MSISSLLEKNIYNVHNKSNTLTNVPANPTGNTNTVWSNSNFTPPHLMYGASDITQAIGNISLTTGSFSLSLSGPWASPLVQNVAYTKINNLVNLTFPPFQANATSSAVINSAIGALPADLRPTTNIQVDFEIFVIDDGNRPVNPGLITLLSNGQIVVYKDNNLGQFTTGIGGSGFNPFSITYMV
ncbi:hypothetical protein za3_19 [Zamilon virus]|uniref:Minor virion protein n=1 Tax=Zamilon virus TaxID=1411887 RepID=A0A2P1EHJ0_9VIRU|nr:Chain A, Zav_19 protein [Zamilon virus]7QRJ_B Chain B, Zav_19 protein [Zamilon virus]7QRJ_C Chain C, Zav_19 protein [Zamilon virus]7QRJ_D Chain D, Zav_19 protein [Zamilon virus]7QRJ_E Chain E, Zav_19 protein [Zamilon virus]7QRJ_F Chain F, Zav_19 protein [Zamilon virus]AVL93359.1 hypothetical protein za3_19 [Zamilon virus]